MAERGSIAQTPGMTSTARLTPLLLSACLASACGGASLRTGGDDASRLDPRRLFPLGPHYSWAYQNDPGGGLPRQTSVLRVADFTGRRARVESLANGNIRTYEVRDDGIYWVESDIYILRAPIALGAEWPSLSGRTARVTDLDASVDVPTGRFDHCVEVQETGGDSGLSVRTIYCPDVGPTLVEAHQALTLGEGVTGTGRLQAYQVTEAEGE